MKQLARRLLVIFLCFSWGVGAQGNAFDRVRYNGGSVSTNVKPDDWDNRLTVASDAIALVLKDGQNIAIPPKQVTSLSYGQEAHRRVGMAVGLAVISLGIGALSALHKTKLHYIGINYTTPDGKKQGILLQGDKSNYRAILVALQGVTGVPVSVGEKDRNELPVGVTTQVASDKADPSVASQSSQTQATTAPSAGTQNQSSTNAEIEIASTPSGADIELDGSFVGSTPSAVGVVGGDHVIILKKNGFKPWERKIKTSTGKVNIAAELEADTRQEQKTEAAVPVQASATPVAVRETAASPPSEVPGKIFITSSPVGAEIYADGLFVGKTPSTMKLKQGQHSILLLMKDYKNWSQTLTAEAGSEVQLTATLEKSN